MIAARPTPDNGRAMTTGVPWQKPQGQRKRMVKSLPWPDAIAMLWLSDPGTLS
jgi:hypothetical protein